MTTKWVAGGQSGGTAKIVYSSDGINWTNSTNGTAMFGNTVNSITHNGSRWVACGTRGTVVGAVGMGYSNDGITWSSASNGNVLGGSTAVAYGGDKFVAAFDNGFEYSYDGQNWSLCTPYPLLFGGGTATTSITYKNSMWVASAQNYIVTNENKKMIAYSLNGINWYLSTDTSLNNIVNSIDFNGTRWVAVGANNVSTVQIAYSATADLSSNWISIRASDASFGTVGRSVKWVGNQFVAVGQNKSYILRSANGISWTVTTTANLSDYNFVINYNSNTWVIGQIYNSASTRPLLYSTNGTTWTNTPTNLFSDGFNSFVKTVEYALPYAGTAPTITNVTNNGEIIYVYFTPGTGTTSPITTYSYSLDGGTTYRDAATTASPIVISSGIKYNINYQIILKAYNGFTYSFNSNIVNIEITYPCFLQGSKILAMNVETDEEEYIPIENLRRGDLIKTSLNGYKAISYIGRSTLQNPASDEDKRNRLYKFPKSKISGMREDLYITGEHCTLHSKISDELLSKTREHMGDVYVTEKKVRIPACLDERAEPYKGKSPVTIWHFALEHDNEYYNYGVYANGLLVESCSIEHMVNRSNMELL